jgi:Zn-dependent peptidase ImmA (M78 family)
VNLLVDLRSLSPQRRLTTLEAYGIAERQATRLLRRSGITSGPVPSEIITELPFVQVNLRRRLNASGATKWIKPRWVILLNGLEPVVRQRFSLAHEYKHVLDHHRRLRHERPLTPEQHEAYERLCHYFAACLLMPRPWVKAAWAAGLQDPVTLARRFEVSPQAMQVRLLQLGLVDPYARCSGMDNVYLRSLPVSPPELAA